MTIVASTISGNNATDGSRVGNGGGGGIFNNPGGTVTLTNTILAANTSADPGVDGSGTLAVAGNNLIGTTASITLTGNTSGVDNLSGASPRLAAFSFYGGPTFTFLPLPGSPAICAAAAASIPSGVTTDQRGFANTNTTYAGYSSASPCVDLGAVQTDYQSMQFAASSYAAAANQAVSPAPVVSVAENGQNIGGIPVTMTFAGTGTASGLGPVTTVAGVGATFNALQVSANGFDTLSASMTVVGSQGLATSGVALTIGNATATTVAVAPASATYGTAQTLTATVTSGGTPVTTGSVQFTDSNGTGIAGSSAFSSQGQVSVSDALSAGTHNITAAYTPVVGYQSSRAATGSFTVAPAALTITASNVAMVPGGAVPSVTPIYSGFVNGDSSTSLTTLPTCAANATTHITSCSGAADPNYTITYVTGALSFTNTLYVTSLADTSGATDCGVSTNIDCTLRSAIAQANAIQSDETITFPGISASSPVSILVTSALPAITTSMTIDGPGANLLTLKAAGGAMISGNAGSLTVSGLSFENSSSAISFSGTSLTVTNSAFIGNASASNGAAISSTAPLTVTGSSFASNSTSTSNGGAIAAQAALSVTNSTFILNSSTGGAGGAIAILGTSGSATLTNDTFVDNSAGTSGGAVFFEPTTGTLTALNNVVAGNIAGDPGAGIAGSATTNVANSVYWHNLSKGAESDCSGCTTNTNAVAASANPLALPMAPYGGTTQTLLPQPGSAAVCAGASTGAPGTDQRGFPTVSTCVDAGADQTNYLSVNGSTETLAAALTAANTAGKQDIDFASALNGSTITLASALPQITGQVNLVGPGANQLAISGGSSSAVGPLLQSAASSAMVVAGLTLEDALNTAADAYGGAVYSLGTVTIVSSAIVNNRAAGSTVSLGAGLFNIAGATVLDSTFSGNTAAGPLAGGAAITATESLTIANSTLSGNTASGSGSSGLAVGGAVYATGDLNIQSSTIFGNNVTAAATSVAGGIAVSGGFTITNTILAGNSATTDPDGEAISTTSGGGNNLIGNGAGITGFTNGVSGDQVGTAAAPLIADLAPLANYGGPTQTMLPLPGSPAICGATHGNVPLTTATDQRGFPNANRTYTGYSASSPCMDIGAVQTNYQSIQFASTALGAAVGAVVTPAPVVSVTENGQNIGGVPVTLSFTGAGAATGLGPVTTTAGTGATFSALSVNAAGSDSLSASLTIVGSDKLTTTPNAALSVGLTAVQVALGPGATSYGTEQTVTATVTVGGAAVTSGTVTFTDADGGTLPVDVSLNSSGQATVTVALAVGAHNITATYNPVTGYESSSAATGAFTITPAAQTINFAAIPGQTYSTTPFLLAATASSGLPVSFSLVSGPATLAGSKLTFTGGGLVTVEANQAGNADYQAATPVTRSFLVTIAGLQVSTAQLAFGGELTGTTSVAQTVTVSNPGASALAFAATVTANVGFAETNDCGATLAAGAKCTVQVTFAPKVVAAASGTLTITSNAIPAGSPTVNEVALSGSGQDLSLLPSGGSTLNPTVTPGQPALFALTITPSGGLTGSIPLTCSVQPATQVSCSVTPTTLVLSGTTPETVSVVANTTGAAGALLALPAMPAPRAPWPLLTLALLALLALLAAALLAVRRRRTLALFVFGAALALAACGGQPTTAVNTTSSASATPAGTYTLTVTAAAEGGSRTAQFTFTVQ